jgi:type II secretory pathway component GspD/PulD (secretin)
LQAKGRFFLQQDANSRPVREPRSRPGEKSGLIRFADYHRTITFTEDHKLMKAKVSTLVLAGLVVFRLAGLAQDTSAASGEQPKPAAAAPAEAPPADPNAVIPLIAIDDLPITDAIKNLARQANLNYLIDPKVAFGVPDATGKVTPQPNVSIRWEKVTAQQALEALLGNYSLQLVDDPKTKISRITVKDPAAPDPLVTKIIQLKHASPSNVLAAVQATISPTRSKVVTDSRTSQLVVVATEKEQVAVDELVLGLDKPTRQVLIEARLMEISRNPTTVKGIDWSGTLEGQNFSFGNGVVQQANTTFQAPGTPSTVTLPGGRTITTTPGWDSTTTVGGTGGSSGGSGGSGSSGGSGATLGSASGGLIPNGFSANTLSGLSPAIGFLNADGVHAVLSFLNKDADTQVISTPRIVTIDNEMASISVARAVPIFKNTAGTQGSPGGSEVQYTNMGTMLHVTPRITASDQVHLKVVPEVSSIFRTVRKTVASTVNEADEYDIRKIETQVLIPSANTLVMGGLMSDSTKNIYTKVPILGDIPGIGLAFRHENKARDKRNLLIFITPTIVKENDFQPSTTDFLKSQPREISGGIDANRAWESAKPMDWSNPQGAPHEEAAYDENAGALKADNKPRPELPPK